MDTVPTQRVLITVLVMLDTRAMEFHVLVRYIHHTQNLIPHTFEKLRLLQYGIV